VTSPTLGHGAVTALPASSSNNDEDRTGGYLREGKAPRAA
jgi:hypothetical protein